MQPNNDSTSAVASTQPASDVVGRSPYEKPQILKKRSVSRATLTSGGGKGGASGGLIGHR
jgi:hypothetical protein